MDKATSDKAAQAEPAKDSAPATPAPADASAAPLPTSREEAQKMGYTFVTNMGADNPNLAQQTEAYLNAQGYEVYFDKVALDSSSKPLPDMVSVWRRRPGTPSA
ncbi:MAG TPA: hypothetical protein VHQ86_02955 [Candidatus Saccharimonadia bacterium]|nr:hypothetical protein [Candidatus Saccharimonadia bacterium]